MPAITPRTGDPFAARVDALLVPVFADEAPHADLDARFDGQLATTLVATRFSGKRDELTAYATFGRLPARWIVLTGLGERGAVTEERYRRAYGAAVKRARDEGARSVADSVPIVLRTYAVGG